jgi:hypothetical protein
MAIGMAAKRIDIFWGSGFPAAILRAVDVSRLESRSDKEQPTSHNPFPAKSGRLHFCRSGLS